MGGCNLNRGFTFIEIMVVIFLMSLIVGITSVYFANFLPDVKFKAAARDLAATIKYAKNLASAKNETQTVNIDLDNKTYSVGESKTKTIPPELIVKFKETLTDSSPVNEGKHNISYDATGGSNWDTIVLIRGQRTITIKSDPIMTAVIKEIK
jgi:prepilin-type N-terminal cleavage/methylation domain-containing protein